MEVGCQPPHALATLPPGKEHQHPLNRRLRGAQAQLGCLWQEKNLLSLLGNKPKTSHPIASSLYQLSIPTPDFNSTLTEISKRNDNNAFICISTICRMGLWNPQELMECLAINTHTLHGCGCNVCHVIVFIIDATYKENTLRNGISSKVH